MLAFPDPIEALECAPAVQRGLERQPAPDPERVRVEPLPSPAVGRPIEHRSRGALRAALLAGLCLLAGLAAAPAAAAAAGLTQIASPINSGRLFDLGVSDFDADGRQELFSTNHKFEGTLAERDPSGGWNDQFSAARFGPNPDYPGFEDLLDRPSIEDPGLYIWGAARSGDDPEKNPTLHILANRVNGIPLLPEQARGRLTLGSPSVVVKRRDGAEVKVSRPGNRTLIDFRVAEQGHIAITVSKADIPPIHFEIQQAPLFARTFVGPEEIRAVDPTFTLRLIDRHGVAWTDANHDGRLDAFIVRGGLGGGIVDFVGTIEDELLLAGANRDFVDRYSQSGLIKGTCRSRLVSAIDYDTDGLLDLFSSCKGETPKLHPARGGGRFGSRSQALAKVDSQGTYYRWVNLRGNRRPELVVLSKERAVVLKSRGKRRWKVVQDLETMNGTKLVYATAIGDYDRDGDPDLFVGANSGNSLLVNREGRLRAVPPRRVGLPKDGSAANWVDFDNDGRLDLHSLPRGLYRQKRNGTFKRTRVGRSKKGIVWGLASWFDLEGDGYRDLATAVRLPGGGADTVDRVDRNERRGNNWLQVDLAGPPGNPQGIGARIRVQAGGETQTGWVGEADGARFSQGHYRVYFGLGDAARVERLTVRWPGGGRTRLGGLEPNQRLVVSPGG